MGDTGQHKGVLKRDKDTHVKGDRVITHHPMRSASDLKHCSDITCSTGVTLSTREPLFACPFELLSPGSTQRQWGGSCCPLHRLFAQELGVLCTCLHPGCGSPITSYKGCLPCVNPSSLGFDLAQTSQKDIRRRSFKGVSYLAQFNACKTLHRKCVQTHRFVILLSPEY